MTPSTDPYGYRNVLAVSFPLIVSMGTTTLILFTDRLFLGWYDVNALAAATPAGIAAFTFMALFIGTVGYVNTFVAQYVGAKEWRGVGESVWQGLYLALGASVVLAFGSLLGEPLFRWAGHPPEVQSLEVTYYRILMLGAGFSVVRDALTCFYSGRALTRPIMRVSIVGAVVNVPLNYLFINGWGPIPELGIAGAGYATVISNALMALLFALAVFSRRNEEQFGVRSRRAFLPERFRALVRFGLPAGAQFFMDVFAFTFFIFMVGRLGMAELAATNAAFAVNTLSFLPMMGFSIALATLMGQAVGAGRPNDGARATRHTFHMALGYMLVVAVVYVVFPGALMDLFRGDTPPEDYAQVRSLGVVLLRFVAFYTVFDTLNIVYAGALKGAGDSRFVGLTIALYSVVFLMLPAWVIVEVLGLGLIALWVLASFYVCLVGFTFLARFRQGRWRSMSVIHPAPSPVLQPPAVPTPGDT